MNGQNKSVGLCHGIKSWSLSIPSYSWREVFLDNGLFVRPGDQMQDIWEMCSLIFFLYRTKTCKCS